MEIIDYFKKNENLKFRSAKHFYWDSSKEVIYYSKDMLKTLEGKMSLLHEIGHALLGHLDYKYDFELIKMEISAWDKSVTLAKLFNLQLDLRVIDENLKSYFKWLKKRQHCLICKENGMQLVNREYHCLNCSFSWQP